MKSKCLGCGLIIGDDWPRKMTKRGDVCMGCEGKEIEVYRIAVDEHGNGYVEKDFPHAMMDEMALDETYIISKQKMPLVQYANLEEFTGF